MKRSTVPAGSILALAVLFFLFTFNGTSTGQESPAKQAEQAEAKGDFDTALKLYNEVKKAHPKWAAVHFKIAVCQAALGQKKDAASTLREVLKMKSAAPELVSEARTGLQQMLLPKLSDDQARAWKEAQSLIQAGEELRKHETGDLEFRTERMLHAGPYLKAIEVLEKLTKEVPEYAPAHLSLGVANENMARFKQAADEYGSFLAFGAENGLPELEQQSKVRQRMVVCERIHRVDEEFAKRIPGKWGVFHERVGESVTTTTLKDDKTSVTTTSPAFVATKQIELLADGTVNVRQGAGWAKEKDGYWKVVNKRLVVGGKVGASDEWCDTGRLVPSGSRFDGLAMDLQRVRYVRKDAEYADLKNKLQGKWAVTKVEFDPKSRAFIVAPPTGNIPYLFNTTSSSKQLSFEFKGDTMLTTGGKTKGGIGTTVTYEVESSTGDTMNLSFVMPGGGGKEGDRRIRLIMQFTGANELKCCFNMLDRLRSPEEFPKNHTSTDFITYILSKQ